MMSPWLVPSLSGAMVASLVLAGVYVYLYFEKGGADLRLWTAAWSIYCVRSALMLAAIAQPDMAGVLDSLARWVDLAAVLLLLAGSNHFFDRPVFAREWIAAAIVAAVWFPGGTIAGLDFLWVNLPVFGFEAAVFLWTGWLFLHPCRSRTPAHCIVGAGFILWGLLKANFPFLGNQPDVAPWGFMLSAVFTLVVAIGTVLVFFERSERQLKLREADYRERFNGTQAVELVIDPADGSIVDANPAAAAYYGYPIDRLCRMNISAINTMPREELAAEMRSAVAQHRLFFNFRHRLASGEIRDVEVYTSPIQLDGRPVLFSIIHDITKRRQTERQLRAATIDAQRANRAKSEFLASMSHELRTPLNAIIGFSEIIRDQMFGPAGHPKYPEYAGGIRSSAGHLLSLIDGILDMSKIEAGHREIVEESLDLTVVVADCLALVGPLATGSRITMAVHLSQPLPLLRADRRAVIQVLLNLMTNAIKFSQPGGQVAIAARAGSMRAEGGAGGETGIEIVVTDRGAGITPDALAHVFEPFYSKSPMLARPHQGTGLGLAISRHLMEMHGGTLVLESVQGAGTTATARFPEERSLSIIRAQSAA